MATSLMGKVVVGCTNGEILFFKDFTYHPFIFSSFGDLILMLDITLDSKWILAMCTKHLLVIPNPHIGNLKSQEELKQRKPIRLMLDLVDIKRFSLSIFRVKRVGKETFKSARFNTGSPIGCEELIVASIGSYLFLWDFTKIKRNEKTNYVVKKEEEYIVDTQFRFNMMNELIVLTSEALRIEILDVDD